VGKVRATKKKGAEGASPKELQLLLEKGDNFLGEKKNQTQGEKRNERE